MGLILSLVGFVMILIGLLMKQAYASFEVGLMALLFGLYLVIGCGCQSREHRDRKCIRNTEAPHSTSRLPCYASSESEVENSRKTLPNTF